MTLNYVIGSDFISGIGHHSFGPCTYKMRVDRPTHSLTRFSVSRPLFALRVLLKGIVCGVLGAVFVPIFPLYQDVLNSMQARQSSSFKCFAQWSRPETHQSYFILTKPHTRC